MHIQVIPIPDLMDSSDLKPNQGNPESGVHDHDCGFDLHGLQSIQ